MLESHGIRPTPGARETQRLENRPGALPAALARHDGPAPTELSVIVFGERGVQSHRLRSVAELEPLAALGRPLWLRIQGLAEIGRITEALRVLDVPSDFHRPLLEQPQRTRVDSLGDGLVVVLHRMSFAPGSLTVVSEQLGLLLLDRLLVSVEEVPSAEPFPVLSHWLVGHGVPGAADLDDVLHYLIDELLDGIAPLLEQFANRLDDLEERALREPTPGVISRAYEVRANLRVIRRQIWPLRTDIQSMLRQNHRVLGEQALQGFTDMGQHVEMLFGSCELMRYHCDAVTDAYMASTGNRMNQVMKTLAIITSIFAPLSLIAGIYGMNFKNMPDLNWKYGYYVSLLAMVFVAGLQAYVLWRRGWFENWTASRAVWRSPQVRRRR
ncbi:MAG: CorA family divalent cation transporter [Prochlorococcaceae cyanobacterium]